MAETGVLRHEARVELLNGEVFDMPPISPFRSGVVGRLTRLFTVLSKDRWLVLPRNPLALDDQSETQPDLLLLKPSTDDYTSHHPRPEDVFLLVEVSDAGLTADLQQKLPAYARAKVPEVWIVSLNDATIECYRAPQPIGYGPKTVLRAGAQGHPAAFPDVAVDVAQLLRRDVKQKGVPAQMPQQTISSQFATQFQERQRAEAAKTSATQFQQRLRAEPQIAPIAPSTPSALNTQFYEKHRAEPTSASLAQLQERHRAEIEKSAAAAAEAAAKPEPELDSKVLDVLTLLCGSTNELSPLQIAMSLKLSPEMAEKYIDELLRRRFIVQCRGGLAGSSGSGQTTFQIRSEGRKYVDEHTWNP